jgi:hypothetical protein
MTALIGGPCFVYLMRARAKRGMGSAPPEGMLGSLRSWPHAM